LGLIAGLENKNWYIYVRDWQLYGGRVATIWYLLTNHIVFTYEPYSLRESDVLFREKESICYEHNKYACSG